MPINLIWLLMLVLYFVPHYAESVETHPNETNSNHINYFKLVISTALNVDASVSYHTQDRTAKAGEDYIAKSGIAVIPAGETEVLIGITILADNLAEADESFDLVIKQPNGASFANKQTTVTATHTIVDDDTTQSTQNHPLQRVSNNSTFEATLKQLMLQTYGKVNPIIYYAVGATAGGAADSSSTANNTSTTNTQVSGVDEADRLKNDRTYLYVAASEKATIKAFSTQTGTAVLSDKITLDTDYAYQISGLYLLNEQLIALSGNNNYYWDQWFSPNYWINHSTRLNFLNAQAGKLSKQSELQVEGQLISSRRIDSTLYLVTRYTPSLKGLSLYPVDEQEAANNRSLITAASLSDLLPNYSLDGSNQGDIFNASNCFSTSYNDTTQQQISLINVVSIDLNNPTAKPQGMCFIGDAESLYVSTRALYLATTQYAYQNNNGIAFYSANITTDIHKFALNGSDIAYKGSAEVNGHLGWQQDLKSFRMGEFSAENAPDSESIFGIITYTGNQLSTTGSPASLYTLQEDSSQTDRLKILAQLPNNQRPATLGKPNEQIYATRFMGNKAYLVTFRSTDPLYILDMSNPADPFVAGELQIDGYSDYLHPIGDQFILGIGKDAIASSNDIGDFRGAWYQGVKLSLIDISNPQLPVERWQQIIGKRGTNTAVSTTHHAFTSVQNGNTIQMALPISLHENSSSNTSDTPTTYHDWQYNALYSYNINTETGDLSPVDVLRSNATTKYASQWQQDRSAIVGGKLYYLSGDEIISR